MTDDTTLPFAFPAVCKKKISAAFDGGRISSDGGVMLLAQAERNLMIAFPAPRKPIFITHLLYQERIIDAQGKQQHTGLS